MELLFTVDSRHHGTGQIVFAWHPEGNFIASAGSSRVVQVFDQQGELIDQVVPPSPSACSALEWSRDGSMLCITQVNSGVLVLWDTKTKSKRLLDVGLRDIVFVKWSKLGSKLAIGTGKGTVDIYDDRIEKKQGQICKPKKKLLCAAWSHDNRFAYACEDRQSVVIYICDAMGNAVDEINGKVLMRPLSISFGGQSHQTSRLISVNMEGKKILLYDLNQREKFLVLAFPECYGNIVSYRWLEDGYIIAGLSTGYVVVVSTHLTEIGIELGIEQYCARVHRGDLQHIEYCEATSTVATCSGTSIKVVSMKDWKILLQVAMGEISREAGLFDKLSWTRDGRILSVSSRTGYLYNFSIRVADKHFMSSSRFESLASHLKRPIKAAEIVVSTLGVCLALVLFAVHEFDLSAIDVLYALGGISPAV